MYIFGIQSIGRPALGPPTCVHIILLGTQSIEKPALGRPMCTNCVHNVTRVKTSQTTSLFNNLCLVIFKLMGNKQKQMSICRFNLLSCRINLALLILLLPG